LRKEPVTIDRKHPIDELMAAVLYMTPKRPQHHLRVTFMTHGVK